MHWNRKGLFIEKFSIIPLTQSVIMYYRLYFILVRIQNSLNIELQVSPVFSLAWSFWQTASKILAQLF